MNILTLTPWYPNSENQTLAVFVREQSTAIARHLGHNVVLIAPFASRNIFEIDSKTKKFDKGSLTEILVPYRPEKTIFDKYLKRKQAIKKGFKEIGFEPDLFHVHEYQMVSMARSLIGTIPIILTEHSTTLSSNLGIKKYLARKAFKTADVVIPVSQYQKDRILSIEQNANVEIINNFVDDRFLSAKKIVKSDKDLRIISVGNLIERKGCDLLIKSIAGLGKNYKLTIVGNGPKMDELKILADELGASDKVDFTGALDREDVLKKITESDIFVSASKLETFGIAILEALAVGIPVVTYDNGGISDFMKDFCGIVVSQYTPEAFSETLKKMIESISDYDSQSIKKYVKENFSSESFAKKVNDIYKEY